MVTFSHFFLIVILIKSVQVKVVENAGVNAESEIIQELKAPYDLSEKSNFEDRPSDIIFHARKRSPVLIKKCCPWGTFFDIETLTCEVSSDGIKRENLTLEEVESMESSFVKHYIRDYADGGNRMFSIGIVSCDHTRVFTSQVTTEFSLEAGIPKVEGKRIKDDYCIDGRNRKGTVLLRCQHENVCKSRPCIRKCKPFGDFFGRDEENVYELPRMKKEFHNLNTMKVDSLVSISSFGLYLGNPCGGMGFDILNPDEEPADLHYLGSDGRLHIPDAIQQYYSNEEFCIEYVKGENISQVYTFLCFPMRESQLKYYLIAGCLLLSCIFLLATFLVYLFSPRTQTLYGKSLMCYVVCLFSAYLTLAIIQFNLESLESIHCTFSGYATLFFLMAAFFWLNIMAIDMWKTFRSTRLARFNRSKGNAQFLWYSLYVWSISIFATGLTAAADFIPDFVPTKLTPGIGNPDCWFSRYTKGIYIFFITPISVVILVNTILFIDTAWRCWKIKSKVNRMGNQSKKKYAANKTQLIINAKLFIAMGVVWSLEVISELFDHPIWYLSDAANALHGVFIFAVFVMKKKVMKVCAFVKVVSSEKVVGTRRTTPSYPQAIYQNEKCKEKVVEREWTNGGIDDSNNVSSPKELQ